MQLPHFTTTTIDGIRVLVDDLIAPESDAIVLDSTNTDAGATPTHRFRPGNVVILETATGRYVEANDANADAPAPASVSADETADVDWQSAVMTFTLNGGVPFTVTLGAGDDTDAEVVIAYNANAVFSASLIADVFGGVVRVRTLKAGPDQTLHINSDLATAYLAAGTAGIGADPDVRVTLEHVDLQDSDGVAIDASAWVARTGHFDLSNLIVGGAVASATDQNWIEARAVLERRGARFSS